MGALESADDDLTGWLGQLAERPGGLGALLRRPAGDQHRLGYGHTLREICQQPLTWPATVRLMQERTADWRRQLDAGGVTTREGSLFFTGSGSSCFVGESLALSLQAIYGSIVQAVPTGLLLTHARASLPRSGRALLVSCARSGNSPESAAAVDVVLEQAPECRHLILTCNREGLLATRDAADPRVQVIVLDDRTNDRSLVMTSSFTNLLIAALAFAHPDHVDAYRDRVARVSEAARALLQGHADAVARVARQPFASAVFLGTGVRLGTAREAALKMVEMSAGRVTCLAESYLGLRHGPMSAVHDDTLVVAFLSSDALTRAYEIDLLDELARKRLGGALVVVGEGLPAAVAARAGAAVEVGSGSLGDAWLPPLDAVTGQLLAFFHCLHLDLHPDAPSPGGVINRVVERFTIHREP